MHFAAFYIGALREVGDTIKARLFLATYVDCNYCAPALH